MRGNVINIFIVQLINHTEQQRSFYKKTLLTLYQNLFKLTLKISWQCTVTGKNEIAMIEGNITYKKDYDITHGDISFVSTLWYCINSCWNILYHLVLLEKIKPYFFHMKSPQQIWGNYCTPKFFAVTIENEIMFYIYYFNSWYRNKLRIVTSSVIID